MADEQGSKLVTDAPRGTRSVVDSLFDGTHNPHIDNVDLFTEVYPPVIRYDDKNPGSVFGAGRINKNAPVAQKRAREIVTGLYSFDPECIKMQRGFADTADKEVQPELDKDLFSLNGMHVSMATVKTVSGFPQLPVSALPRDNAKFVKDLGLAGVMNAKQKEIALAVWKKVWSNYLPSSINIPKMSATGPVRMTNDPEYKLQYILAMQTHGRTDRLLNTFMKGDLGDLHRDFEMACVMGVNVRWQVDKPGKQRKYWSLQDCVRFEMPDQRLIETVVEGEVPNASDFAAMRCRLINAGPWPMNSQLQIVSTGHMYAMFDTYAATWHRDEDTLDEFFEGKNIWCGDVSNYDHSFTEEMLDLALDSGCEYWDERVMQMARSLYYAAYFARPMGPDDKVGALVGDPRKYLEKQVIAGNRSGHAFTSLFAKVWKVIDSLYVFDLMGYDVVANLEQFLKGQMPLGLINNGDDEVAWFTRDQDYVLFNQIRTTPRTDSMFKVEREVGNVFSGKVFQKVGPKSYRSVERLNTTFERILCPERSIGGVFRPYWPIGMLERHNKRDSHEVLKLLWDIFDFSWREHVEPTHGSFLGNVQRAAKSIPFSVTGLNWKDVAVLEDPNKLHHRFTPDEINPDVVLSSVSRLHHRHFESFYKNLYKGNLT